MICNVIYVIDVICDNGLMMKYRTVMNQAAMRAEAVLELLHNIIDTISICWGVSGFCGNIWLIYEFEIQLELVCAWHPCPFCTSTSVFLC